MSIHSQDESVIREFALRKPVSRLLVNVAPSLGGVGATTGIAPALTLGCGAVGGSATSDNVSPMNLINIRRVARGIRELSDLRAMPEAQQAAAALGSCRTGCCPAPASAPAAGAAGRLSTEDMEAITRAILKRLAQ